VLLAIYFMVTAKHSIQEVISAVAIQAGTKIDKPDIKEYEGDDLSWRLQAETAEEKGKNVILKNPVFDFYTDKRELIPIQSKKGRYDKKSGLMHFEGAVQVKYQSWELNSEKLDYSKTKEEVQVAEDFVMFQEGMKITGKDMRIIKQTGRVKVLKGVKMSIEENH